MDGAQALKDAVVGTVAGAVGTKAMNPVTSKLYALQSDESKQREQEASYGVAYNVAAKKTARTVGVSLDEEQESKAGKALHYALGSSWAPVYMLLRRKARMTPLGAGLVAGVTLYGVVDEALNPVLGFTPPPKAYPLVTHLRGLAGHVVFGVVMAAAIELGWRLLGGRPAGRR